MIEWKQSGNNLLKMHPLVSIITVTKNCDSTIERTLESIKAIKTPDTQYVIIDGKSTDGTLATIAHYEHLVDILISEDDTGIYNAMNKGISLASGRYILFINGDDQLIPDGFIQAKKLLEKTDSDVVCFGSLVVSLTGELEEFFAQPHWLFFYNSVPHPSTFVATEVMKKFCFREDLRIASDYDLFLRMKMARKGFITSKILTAIHRRGGASGDVLKSLEEVEQVKRENLGWLYGLITMAQRIHRFRKWLVNPADAKTLLF